MTTITPNNNNLKYDTTSPFSANETSFAASIANAKKTIITPKLTEYEPFATTPNNKVNDVPTSLDAWIGKIGGQIDKANGANNSMAVIILGWAKYFASAAKDHAGIDKKEVFKGEMIKSFASATGTTVENALKLAGTGNLSALGAVLGDSLAVFMKEGDKVVKDNLPSGLRAIAHILQSIDGSKQGEKSSVFSASMLLAMADYVDAAKENKSYLGTLSISEEALSKANGATLKFIGKTVENIGAFIGGKNAAPLKHAGAAIGAAGGLANDWGDINTKINSDILGIQLTGVFDITKFGINFAKSFVQGSANKDMQTSVEILDLGARAAGWFNPKANPLGFSSVDGGDIASAAMDLTLKVFQIAKIDVPPTVKAMLNQGIAAIKSGASTATTNAAVQKASQYVSTFLSSIGINIMSSTATKVVGFASVYGGVVVQAGTSMVDLFKHGWNNQTGTGVVNLGANFLGAAAGSAYAASMGLGATSVAAGAVGLVFTLPFAALIAFLGDKKIAQTGSLTSFHISDKATAINASDITKYGFGSAYDSWWRPFNAPTSEDMTVGPAWQAGVGAAYGNMTDAKGKPTGIYYVSQSGSASMTFQTSLGEVQLYLHGVGGNTQERYNIAKKFVPTLSAIRTIDGRLADILNSADIENNQTTTGVRNLMSPEYYNKYFKDEETANGRAGATVRKLLTTDSNASPMFNYGFGETDQLNDADKNKTFAQRFPHIVDDRYKNLANMIGKTGTIAGKAYKAWNDVFVKVANPKPGQMMAIADIISQTPGLLDIEPSVANVIAQYVPKGASFEDATGAIVAMAGMYKSLSEKPKLPNGETLNLRQTLNLARDILKLIGLKLN